MMIMMLPSSRLLLIKTLCIVLLKFVLCLPMEEDLQQNELLEERVMMEKSCFLPYYRCRSDEDCSPCQKQCNPRTLKCSSYTEEVSEFSEDVEDEGDADEKCYLYSPCIKEDDCKSCNLVCGWWIKKCRPAVLSFPLFAAGET